LVPLGELLYSITRKRATLASTASHRHALGNDQVENRPRRKFSPPRSIPKGWSSPMRIWRRSDPRRRWTAATRRSKAYSAGQQDTKPEYKPKCQTHCYGDNVRPKRRPRRQYQTGRPRLEWTIHMPTIRETCPSLCDVCHGKVFFLIRASAPTWTIGAG
jgi:hypothetical protein